MSLNGIDVAKIPESSYWKKIEIKNGCFLRKSRSVLILRNCQNETTYLKSHLYVFICISLLFHSLEWMGGVLGYLILTCKFQSQVELIIPC